MSNEATLKLRLDNPIDFTVTNATGIEKGTICKLANYRTASASTGTGDVFAGIAAREKIASDGRTQLACFRRGIFDMIVSAGAGVTVGDWVTSSGANLIRTATGAEVTDGKGIGIALETVATGHIAEILVGGF